MNYSNTDYTLWKQQTDDIFECAVHHTQRAGAESGIRDVHQMRVYFRRMRSILEFFGSRSKAADSLLQTAKQLGRVAGPVRDLDVMIEYFEKKISKEEEPALRFFMHHEIIPVLKNERIAAAAHLRLNLPNIFTCEIFDIRDYFTYKRLPVLLRKISLEDELNNQENKFRKKDKKFRTLEAKRGIHDPKTIEHLHRVRLQAKKLRYAYTYLDFALEANNELTVKFYKKVQKKLGKINDLANAEENLKRLKLNYNYLSAEPMEELLNRASDNLFRALEKIPQKHLQTGLQPEETLKVAPVVNNLSA